MNETVLLKLKLIVERAVRPVQASLASKKKMREELLAHVVGAFENELPYSTDEESALNQVEKRFGDPDELSRSLQQAVPWTDRSRFYFERLSAPRPGESLIRSAVRHGIKGFAAEVAAFIAMSPLLLWLPKAYPFGVFLLNATIISLCCGWMTFTNSLLFDGFVRAMFSGARQSRLKTYRLLFVSCLNILAVLYLSFVMTMSLVPPSVYAVLGVANVWNILCVLVVFSSALVWGWILKCENRYREEWARNPTQMKLL